jgi:O-antigen/teichoic acid export membrane protein
MGFEQALRYVMAIAAPTVIVIAVAIALCSIFYGSRVRKQQPYLKSKADEDKRQR